MRNNDRWRARGAAGVIAVALGTALTVGSLPGVAWAAPAGASTKGAEGAPSEPAPQAGSEAEALAAAKKSGASVEITSMRGESREVFATPEGDLEAREYLRPIRARVDGRWERVDTGLKRTADGMVAPGATTVKLEFSGGGDAPLVSMEKAGRELALTWPTKLPAPELDGSTATYREVLPGVDLRMGAQEDGFTQLLVVKSAEAAASPALKELRLKLGTDGVDVREASEGGLEAVDKGGKNPVFEAPKPMMWDSSPGGSASATRTADPAKRVASATATSGGSENEGEPGAGESGKLAPVDVTLPRGGDELVLTPDSEVLKGQNTQYPVFIDPQWYSPRAAAWTMASKYWASSPQWKFNGAADAGMGFCDWAYCAPSDTKRLFYRIPTSTFAGKTILSAEFVVRNVHSASCDSRDVELWLTKDISASTTWNSQNASGFWVDQLKKSSFAYGADGCAAKDAEFDVKSAVQRAANGKWAVTTFGLQATNETDKYAWKRFSDKAFLRVKYNRPPSQIPTSQLSMEYGGICHRWNDPARVRTLGKIYANKVTDPDGDSVSVEFQGKWDAGDGKGNIARWQPARTAAKASGSNFSISLPTSLPKNKTIEWYVRSYDGAQYSPWSWAGDPNSCYFIYDTSVPAAPAIASGEYPASDPENPNDPWYDGVGQYGTFSIGSASTDAVRYRYGFNTDPSAAREITTTGGAAKSVQFLPAQPGLNFVTAQAFDQAGNGSEIRTYQFRVKSGQPDRASWQLDEPAGATTAAGTVSPRTIRLNGGATMGAEGKKGTALQFDGTSGYAGSDLTVVDTSDSFSVAAWVRLDRMPTNAAIIAAQPGNYKPGFELYYSQGYNRWVFNQYTSDTAGASIARAMGAAPGDAKAGEWTHLVGVYDNKAKQLRLYVNGALAGTTAYTTAWEARRGLQLGAGTYDGTPPGNFFPGTVDDVRIYDRAVSTAEAALLQQGKELTSGRLPRAVFPLDEAAGTTEATGQAAEQPLTFNGGVTSGAKGINGKALTLDGTTGYAATDRPVLNTGHSYSVSAWAKLPAAGATGNRTVVSQSGTYYSPFYLSYEGAENAWSLRTSLEDVQAGNLSEQRVLAKQPARLGEWAHLVAVYDANVQQIRLYVNGALQGSDAAPKTWEAQGPVQIGRAIWTGKQVDYFPGSIDEVRLFERPVSDEEVQQMFRQRALVTARWKLDSAGTTTPATSPDDAGSTNAMTLAGGAKVGPGFMESGLVLDGVGGYASAPTVPFDTSTSFTITGWAQAAATPGQEVAVVSAEGATQSAFAIRFVPDAANPGGLGRWEVVLPDTDTATPAVKRVANTVFTDVMEWNHLALVYDGFTKQARLYVNGNLQEVACSDADGDGASDEPGCQDLISWAEDTLTFKAGKSLQIGRAKTGGAWGNYFPGVIDDVWAFQGALTDRQVEELAGNWFDPPTQVPAG
ncbi:LamG-like jellyroll fold domain-containing protein [Streptomyces laurentii]|uniref:LamG-like jellyroll fold domain-containing protein n=1 Tax=Streptomyces laurentii TaxID=39478 RepID=UPI0036B9415E